MLVVVYLLLIAKLMLDLHVGKVVAMSMLILRRQPCSVFVGLVFDNLLYQFGNYHVEQDRDACSNLTSLSNMYPQRCSEFRANSDTVCRSWFVASFSGPGNCVISLVLKLFCIPNADDSAAQLLIKSFPSSNHIISGLSDLNWVNCIEWYSDTELLF